MRQPIPFGKYLLLERISVGGMAEVFKSKSFGVEGFEKIIAIKRILPTMVEDADFIQMFIDEAKIAGQLSHANICQIFELGKIAESHFIAMEFIWGKDLLQIQNRFRKLRQAMPVAMAAFIAAKMCEGLDYAHKKKDARGSPLLVVHRDVSPQNILVSYEGEIKLIDFGIAKAAIRSSKTQAGVLKGKFGYMSPEQVRGLPLDRRSDLFALGTILYEMLTGERLFLGESDFSTLERVRNVDISPPSQHNKNVPPALEKIVMKSLAKEPEDRYQWANELQEDLLQFVMGIQPVFTPKQLAVWMKDAFSPELARERQLLEQYKKLGRDGLVAGKAAAANKTSIVEGLGKPGPADDGAESTALEGPGFEDALEIALSAANVLDEPSGTTDETLAAIDDPLEAPTFAVIVGNASGKGSPLAGRASKGGSQGFGDEGPTEIFGEVESRPNTTPPPMMAAESTVILPNGSSATPVPAPLGSPSARLLAAGSPAVGAPAMHTGTTNALARPTPATASMSLTGVPSAPLGAMATPSAPIPAPTPASLRAVPRLPSSPPMPVAPPPPAFTGPVPTLPPAAPLASAFGPAGDQGLLTAAMPKLLPAPTRRTLARDVGIGVLVAVLVLGVVVGGRFLLGGGRARTVAAVAPMTGTIVVAAIDNGPGEVFVNGQKRGDLIAGAEPLTLEGLEGGDYAIVVRRAGVPDCAQSLALDERRPAVVACRFGPAPVAHGKLVLKVATADAIVFVDSQEISADAAREPLLLAPRVEHTVTVEKPGFTPQSLQIMLGDGEVQERSIELAPAPPARGERTEVKDAGPRPRPVARAPVERADKPASAISMAGKLVADKRVGDDGENAASPTDDMGYLIANTTPYAKVLIDSRDTGKMTPIAPRAKIPLRPGKHTVTFVVGSSSFNYPVMIEAGRDHRLIKTLPVQ